MLVIGTMPLRRRAAGRGAGRAAVLGASACGPVKSAALSSVSCVPPFLRRNTLCAVGRREGRAGALAVGAAGAAQAVRRRRRSPSPPALRSWAPPVSAMPVPYVWSPGRLTRPALLTSGRPCRRGGSSRPGSSRASSATSPLAFVPHTCQPPIATGARGHVLELDQLVVAAGGPRNMTFEMTTVVDGAACAAGAATHRPKTTAAATRKCANSRFRRPFREEIRELTAMNVSSLRTPG